MHRRNFDSAGHIVNTLSDYPEAMRQLALQDSLPLIDLNAMSKTMYEAWGPEESIKAFVHFPANSFPGQTRELKDNTHFSTYGAYELAKCVVQGVRAKLPALAAHLKEGLPEYNSQSPAPAHLWHWPWSPAKNIDKPDGN